MSPRSIDEWIIVLQSDSRERAQTAAEALGRLGGPDACAALGDALLGHNEISVRVACANALGVMGGSAAAEALVSALNEPDRVIWHAAAEALAGLDDDALSAVTDILQRPDPALRRAALSALLWLTVEHNEAEPSMSDGEIWGMWGWWN